MASVSDRRKDGNPFLDELNQCDFVKRLGTRITRIAKWRDGRSLIHGIVFSSGSTVTIPSLKALKSPRECELLIAQELGRSVTLPKQANIWWAMEADLILQAAVWATPTQDYESVNENLEHLISDTSLWWINPHTGTELEGIRTEAKINSRWVPDLELGNISGRSAARVFAEQMAQVHFSRDRYVIVQSTNGLFLHPSTTREVYKHRFGEDPGRLHLSAALSSLGYFRTHPYPTRSGNGYKASVRMRFKPEIGEV